MSSPRFERIEAYLRHYVKVTPDAEACVDETHRLTYKMLLEQVEKTASALAQAGVMPGDFVATHAPPSTSFYVTFLATQMCGATWVGLNPKYQKEEIEYVLKDAKPKIVFVRLLLKDRTYASDFISIKNKLATNYKMISLDEEIQHEEFEPFSDFIKNIKNTPPLNYPPSMDCMMVYTSGSTGKPKGALLPHHSLIQAARIRHSVWHRQAMRTLLNVPINHIGGAGDITCTTLIGGGTLVCTEKFNPLKTLQIIEKEKLSFLYQTPTQMQMTFFLPEVESYDLSSLKAVVWSGARASQSLIKKLFSLFGDKLGTDYSMTESVGAVTMTPLTNDLEILGNSVGWMVPDRKISIQSESGEIVLHDPYIMSGYYNRPEATATTIEKNGLLHTNDIGKQLPNGAIALTGRMSNMFKSGGYNIYPAEIEKVLEEQEEIGTAIVLSAPDELWGEAGHSFLSPTKGKTIDTDKIKEYCHTRLANYKVPKSFIIIKKMPKLPIGKIDRAALKAQLYTLLSTQ